MFFVKDKKCLCCGKMFHPANKKRKYCSRPCSFKHKKTTKGHCYITVEGRIRIGKASTARQLGRKLPESHKENLRKAKLGKIGEKANAWKGENAGYRSKHYWIESRLGKPMICSFCLCTNKKRYHWANINHKYRRKLTDWIRLCVPCHVEFDKKGEL